MNALNIAVTVSPHIENSEVVGYTYKPEAAAVASATGTAAKKRRKNELEEGEPDIVKRAKKQEEDIYLQ